VNKLVCALLLCVAATFGQNSSGEPESRNRTIGMVNGRYWQLLSADERSIFVIALIDGVRQFQFMRDGHEDDQQVLDCFLTPKFTFQEMADEITKLYQEPAKLRIPVATMEVQAATLLNGGTPDVVEKHMAGLRKVFNQ
jgi:hypothetical protein